MIPIVELPIIVQHYAPCFQEVFTEAALIEFERYISGLIVSENHTVDGINRLFVCGLATDFCVAWSAEDAIHLGHEVVVIEDACRGIDLDGSACPYGSDPRERETL